MQKSVVNFKQEGCIFHLNGKQTTPPSGLSPNFFGSRVHDIITLFKFGNDRFRGFGLAEGQSCFSHILCRSSLQHSHYRVRCDPLSYGDLGTSQVLHSVNRLLF